VAPRDQHRVLAVKADTCANRGLSVDVLVVVHEHPVLAAQTASEAVEPLAELGVAVAPGVARKATLARTRFRGGRVVAEGGGDDRASRREEAFGVARDLGASHRELHVGEQPSLAALADVPLGVRVGGGRSGADDVEPQLLGQLPELTRFHSEIVHTIARVKAIRIHEDGGPEVLRYEDAPDPANGPGEVLVQLRAASLNHLDLWIRKGLPSVPKPRILGADGAGLLETGERVVINPGIDHRDGRITVIGEHTDGTQAELIAVPETNVYPIPDGLGFEEAAAFPLVFETAYRMLVTKAALQPDEWVLVWGIGGGVALASLAIAKALGARVIVTSSDDEKLARAGRLGADSGVNHSTRNVVEAVKEATGGRGADVVVEHVGQATWERTLQAARVGGRIAVCGATSGPNPPAALHRIWWKQLTIYGSTMGTKEDFEGAYELVASGRARAVIDSVFPLSEARAAHERLESGSHFGKVVLRIPS
jgi:NADPH:quinone reductase-like Zn-dependent oxidoreductase